MSVCQKCRQPLFMEDSLAALSPSAYDIIGASLSDRQLNAYSSESQASQLSRLPPSLRPLYTTASSPRSYTSSSGSNQGVLGRTVTPAGGIKSAVPSVRVTSPYSTSLNQHQNHFGPGESFVVLTESVVGPARTASHQKSGFYPVTKGENVLSKAEAASSSSSSPQEDSDARRFSSSSGSPVMAKTMGVKQGLAGKRNEETTMTAPLTPRLTQLSHLHHLLSSKTSVDHPLCAECMETLLALMGRELDEAKKERDKLVTFEHEAIKKQEEGTGKEKEVLEKDILKLKKIERQAIEELKNVDLERETIEKERKDLDAEEAALAGEEEEFWRSYSTYSLQASSLRDQVNALQTQYAHDLKELEKLQKTNVYNDAFCIGQEAGFGTINGLRLGRLPGAPVDWPEINAAWGHTLLLLHTIARKFNFTFETYRLVPMGSFSHIEKITGDKAIYELYGSGDFAVMRMLQNRRFDTAMVAFLDCLRQMMEYVKSKDPMVNFFHAVFKDKIGDVSIKLQFGSAEVWTRALRHVLLDLKILLGRASL